MMRVAVGFCRISCSIAQSWRTVIRSLSVRGVSIVRSAVYVIGHDSFDSLQYTERPVSELGDNEVLVKSTSPIFGANNLIHRLIV
jgi:hypothetical protein